MKKNNILSVSKYFDELLAVGDVTVTAADREAFKEEADRRGLCIECVDGGVIDDLGAVGYCYVITNK